MSDLYFSTVFLFGNNDQAGELVQLDFEKGQVLQRAAIGPKTLQFQDPNPRGNSRGGRGIALMSEYVVVCSYCEVQIYDRKLRYQRVISHPLMSGLHEVCPVDDHLLWLTSCSLDVALLLNLDSGEVVKQFWVREMPALQKRWGIKALPVDKTADNRLTYLSENSYKDPGHLHLNALAVHQGELLGLINRFGAVVNLNTQQVLLEDPHLKGAHNLVILDDGTLLINNSKHQEVAQYDLQGKLVKQLDLRPFHPAGRLAARHQRREPLRHALASTRLYEDRSIPPFKLRGLQARDGKIFIGMCPAAVLCVDWQRGSLLNVYNYTKDDRIGVHGLQLATTPNMDR